MKALFFLYEGYVDWEISPLSYMLNISDVSIKTTALSDEVTHQGNFTMKADLDIEACDPAEYDILIIPGGEPAPIDRDERLLNLIKSFDDQGRWIAAICGAPTFLAAAGVLRERTYSTSIDDNPEYAHYFNDKFMSENDVTVCENLITAEGNAYIEFAIAVGKELDIFEDREDELETVLFFKNQLRS
ncbi:DJ-1/PfpI family protein [Halobacillus sp. A5]|uniref:DJ-1/PfpI family protein n=1 Tax=Halobacillus sp. A5 TaxID=2880263 RepID=UPI0020A65218|nr:DJ-1/PfpI family protein [Halobacillus sp. A5]MCP3026421.1 DJ-1/PfpI family protein [Halobacillus sp. A5]